MWPTCQLQGEAAYDQPTVLLNYIERLQNNACRTILKESYINYENALDTLNLDTLEERRVKLSLTLAKNCREKNHTEKH